MYIYMYICIHVYIFICMYKFLHVCILCVYVQQAFELMADNTKKVTDTMADFNKKKGEFDNYTERAYEMFEKALDVFQVYFCLSVCVSVGVPVVMSSRLSPCMCISMKRPVVSCKSVSVYFVYVYLCVCVFVSLFVCLYVSLCVCVYV